MNYGASVTQKNTLYDPNKISTVNFDSSRKSIQIANVYSGIITVPAVAAGEYSRSGTFFLGLPTQVEKYPYTIIIESSAGNSVFMRQEVASDNAKVVNMGYVITEWVGTETGRYETKMIIYSNVYDGTAYHTWDCNFRMVQFKIPFPMDSLRQNAVYEY